MPHRTNASHEVPAPISASLEEPALISTSSEVPAPISASREEPAPISAVSEEPAPTNVGSEGPALISAVEDGAPQATAARREEGLGIFAAAVRALPLSRARAALPTWMQPLLPTPAPTADSTASGTACVPATDAPGDAAPRPPKRRRCGHCSQVGHFAPRCKARANGASTDNMPADAHEQQPRVERDWRGSAWQTATL